MIVAERDRRGHIRDFHALRHSYATILAKSYVPLAMAQKMMRHSDPKLTTEFYIHAEVGAWQRSCKAPQNQGAEASQNPSSSFQSVQDIQGCKSRLSPSPLPRRLIPGFSMAYWLLPSITMPNALPEAFKAPGSSWKSIFPTDRKTDRNKVDNNGFIWS